MWVRPKGQWNRPAKRIPNRDAREKLTAAGLAGNSVPTMVRLTIFRGEERIREQVLNQPVTALGRHTDNDVVLDDLALSRFHARLELRGEHYVVVDLGSQNGVYVNGIRVSGEQPLHPGDRIGMGRYLAVFDAQAVLARGGQRHLGGMPAPLDPASPANGPSLLLRYNGTDMERFPLLGDGYIIGRSHRCDIVIGLLGLSRRHARVSLGARGWQVEDLGSQNGTFVNEQRIQGPHLFRDGDALNFFEYTLVFQDGRTRASSSRARASKTDQSNHALEGQPPRSPPLRDPVPAATVVDGGVDWDELEEEESLEEADRGAAAVHPGGDEESLPALGFRWPQDPDVESALAASRLPAPVAHVEIHQDGHLLTEVPLDRSALRIGSDARCDVALPPLPGVAPWHLVLVRMGAAALLMRVGNARPPSLSGRRMFQAFLRDGERVDIGRITLVFKAR